jgi:hypothetical protein
MDKAGENEYELNESDRKVVMKNLLNQVFPSLAITLLIFLVNLIYSGLNHSFGLLFVFLTGIAIFSGVIAFLLLSKKYRSDLKINTVKFEEVKVDKINYRVDYEPGSASMPVNIFSFLFPKIYNRAMKEIHIYEIMINGELFYIEKEEYNMIREGATVSIKRAFHSNLYLGIIPGLIIEK